MSHASVLECINDAIQAVTIASDQHDLERRVLFADRQLDDAWLEMEIDEEELADFKLELALALRARRKILSI